MVRYNESTRYFDRFTLKSSAHGAHTSLVKILFDSATKYESLFSSSKAKHEEHNCLNWRFTDKQPWDKIVLISVTFGSYQESSHFLVCKHCFSKDLSFRNVILEAVLFFSWTNWYHHSSNPYFLLFRRTSQPENLRPPIFPWQTFLAI